MRLKNTLVLIPGLLCDRTVFEPLLAALPTHIETVIPALTGADSITGMAEDILQRTQGTLSVLGFSMGARVALEMIRLAPERIQRLALLDTGVHAVKPGEPMARQVVIDIANNEGMQALSNVWLPPMLTSASMSNPTLRKSLEAMVLRMTPEIHERQINALTARPDATTVLKKIKCPTLLGVGEQDKWSPVSLHEEMHQVIKNSTLAVFPDAGHFALVENPTAVNRAVLDWLAD